MKRIDTILCVETSVNARIFSAQNRQKKKNIQPEPEKLFSYIYKKKRVYQRALRILFSAL